MQNVYFFHILAVDTLAAMAKEKPIKEQRSPLDAGYMKTMIFTMSMIGCWPHKEISGKEWIIHSNYAKCLTFMWIITNWSLASYWIKNYKVHSFFVMGRTFIHISMIIVSIHRLSLSWSASYKNITIKFVRSMHLFHHKDKGEFAMQTYKTVEKHAYLMTILLHMELYLGTSMYNVIPLIINYRNGMYGRVRPENMTFEHGAFFDLPFDHETNFRNYALVSTYIGYVVYCVSNSFCMFDLIIFLFVLHLCGHIKILKNDLLTFPRSKDPLRYNQEESQHIKKLLIESMIYYKEIKANMLDVSMSFGAIILFYYLFHQICGCVLLVELLTIFNFESFGTYGILTCTLFQLLMQMSIIFEVIATESETVKDAVYEVPWQNMDNSNRKIVLMYLCNVQEPMEMKALGILPVGVRVMASIIKTSLSYYMFLRSTVNV